MTNRKQHANGARSARPVAIVGMGASAGGLEAFQKFFGSLPNDSGLAFVLVQHLDPTQETHIPELLARHAAMPFQAAKDRDAPAANTVHVIPPGTELHIEDGCLRVREPTEARGRRRPIDHFLRSLAEDQEGRAVGIVLSGTGSDGSLGMQAIREHGGLTIAQEPASARYDSMPRNAITLGAVDQVLAPEEMPKLLVEHARRLRSTDRKTGRKRSGEIEARLAELCRILRRKVQHDFSQYKRSTLVRRIERRMLVLQSESLEQYLETLRQGDEEARRLFKDLLISVTTFFRDPEAFEAIGGTIRKLLVEPSDRRRLRVWVPGCATGEEAYSLAMLITEEMEEAARVVDVQIFATDIDEAALKVAREGRYPEGITDHVSPERLRRFFVWRTDGYQVAKELRDMCIFSAHNLIRNPPFSRIDLMSCRNVLIYLRGELQDRLIPMFHYALRSDGYLFLGPAENIGRHTDLFQPIDKKHRIFQARNVAFKHELIFPLIHDESVGHIAKQVLPLPRASRPARDLGALHQRQVLEMSGLKSVLIDESCKIIDLCGRLGAYLELGWGPVGDNIIEMARPELRVRLRAVVHEAQKSGTDQIVRDLALQSNGVVQRFDLLVRRFSQAAHDGDLWLVIFRELEPPRLSTQAEAVSPSASEDPLVRQLESELESTRMHLQSTVEELETSNEELTSSVEELLSMNEELQSSNEELQSAKEELQSVNEELETVNVELQGKMEDLDRAHADLRNLFESTRIPTLFLDRELRIKHFTPATQDVLRLIRTDVGRRLHDITPWVEGADMVRECQRVLETLVPLEMPVLRRADEEGPERRYLLRIFPYRTLDEVIDGVVLTFVDVTELEHATEAALRREQQQAAVSRLGLQALSGASLDELQHEAAVLVQRSLHVDQGEVLALVPGPGHGEEELLLCAGVGWREGLVGEARIPAGRCSHAGYALLLGAPVIFTDLDQESRFSPPALLVEHGVRSGLACVIQDGEERSFGVIGAHSRDKRVFSQQDADFLQTVANVLGSATGWRRALERLHASEAEANRQAAELGTIYDTAAVGLALLDRDLRWVSINRTLAELDGFSVEQHLGRRPGELLHSITEEVESHLHKVIDTGEAIRDVEIRAPRPGGSESIWLYSFTPVHDEEGRVQAASVVVHDVTGLRRAEQKIFESERRVRLALEALEAGVFECSVPIGEHFYPSEPCARIIGRSLDELPPAERLHDWLVAEIVHPEDIEALATACKDFVEGRASRYRGDVRLRHRDGRWIWVRGVAVATEHDEAGCVRCITGLMWDVTEVWNMVETKQAQVRLLEADRQKNLFLAMLGHELRNPLAAIRTSAELLQQVADQEPLLERIRAVLERQTAHMARLIEGLLDVSRIAQGKLRLHKSSVDLGAILRAVLDDCAEHMQKRGLTLRADLGAEPIWVTGDRTRLAQVFDNLVGNAIKFTVAPGTIDVTAGREDESAVATVRDTGIGIDPAIMERLFEPFQQVPQTMARTAGGLGLGLALVKGIVDLHGGRLEARSEGPGTGTEFRVWLPVAAPLRPEESEGAPGDHSSMRILVVEDNEDSAMMLSQLLERAGHRVCVAHTGTEAIALARQHRPDAVLCDLGLPGMDGYEVARAIRGDPALQDTALLALTGYGQAEDRRKSAEAGFDVHLTKPVDLGTIEAALAQVPRAG